MNAVSNSQRTESSRDWVTIVLLATPIMVGLLILLVVMGMAIPGSPIHLKEPGQLSIVTDTVFSIMVLCPLMICFAPLCLALVVSVYGLHKLNGKAEQRLQQMQVASRSMSERAITTADSLNRRSIEFNVKATFATRFLNVFEHQVPKGSSDVNEAEH